MRFTRPYSFNTKASLQVMAKWSYTTILPLKSWTFTSEDHRFGLNWAATTVTGQREIPSGRRRLYGVTGVVNPSICGLQMTVASRNKKERGRRFFLFLSTIVALI